MMCSIELKSILRFLMVFRIFQAITNTEQKEEFLLHGDYLNQLISSVNLKKKEMINSYQTNFKVKFEF